MTNETYRAQLSYDSGTDTMTVHDDGGASIASGATPAGAEAVAENIGSDPALGIANINARMKYVQERIAAGVFDPLKGERIHSIQGEQRKGFEKELATLATARDYQQAQSAQWRQRKDAADAAAAARNQDALALNGAIEDRARAILIERKAQALADRLAAGVKNY